VDLLSSLNPEQQAAVVNTDGPLLILAGAGSGKTRVIAHRIAYLVSEGLSEPDRILAVTFTNKAAEEMRSRVEALLGVDCRQMWVSTFHALCARLLRREAPHIGLSRDFVIYDSTDQLTVVKQALKSLGIDDGVTQPRAALSRISHAKNRMEGPAVFSDATWNPREQQIAKIYELYTKALKDANALDFDDLLSRPSSSLSSRNRSASGTAEVPLPDGGRVSRHEPAAVPADSAPRRCASQPVRRW
jgi:DNA helicase-2/ATP-dependent DNA helicase PcrA